MQKRPNRASGDDPWFLPGPMDDEPDSLPPGPAAEPRETEVFDDRRKAEGRQLSCAVPAVAKQASTPTSSAGRNVMSVMVSSLIGPGHD